MSCYLAFCLTTGFFLSPEISSDGMVPEELARTSRFHSGGKQEADRLKNERMNRIPNRENMSKSRVANITSTVALFERWLWDSHENESRGIHDIPPDELDVYLADFFGTIKQPNGNNYSPGSLKSLRGYLDFYLRCTNYPYSITSISGIFWKSQEAYKRKINEIRKEMASQLR